MIKAAEFMVRHGMNADRIELDTYSKAINSVMRSGLAVKQKVVPMIPTYLRGEKQVPRDRKVAVVDAGGTNFRTALVSFTKDGFCVERMEKHDMPGAKSPATWEEFIAHTAKCLLPVISDAEAVGFCFSYPAEVTPDIDSRVLNMTKQVTITGAEGRLLGKDLMEELMRLGAERKRIVVLNDTPATLLSGSALLDKRAYGGFIGLVAGTGVNACCMLPENQITKMGFTGEEKMLINLETGSYCGFPQGDFDVEMDATLPDTGKSTNEKMCSGRYIGQLCLRTLRAAAQEGVFSEKGKAFIEELEFMTATTSDKWGSGKLPKGIFGEDAVNMVYIINEIFDRAARCTACILCGILMLTGEGEEKPVCIAVDGSLYKKGKLFKPMLEDCMAIYAEEIMGRKFEFVTADEATMLGTAAAVLLN